jgi:hypothetical protein
LFQANTVDPWEMKALNSYAIMSSVRSNMIVLGVLLAAFIVFMAVDACRSAKAINAGKAPPIHIGRVMSDKPVGPLILIGLGVLFLLQQLDVFRIGWIFRYWPVILIAIGAWMLYRRQQSS